MNRYALLAQMDGQGQPQAAPQAAPSGKGIGWGPYAALAGGEMADILSTKYGLDHGAHEANPIMGKDPISVKGLALKAAMSAPMAILMRMLDKSGHDTLAKALGYGSGIGLGAVAAHNVSVAKK